MLEVWNEERNYGDHPVAHHCPIDLHLGIPITLYLHSSKALVSL